MTGDRFEAVCDGCGLNTIVTWDGEEGLCDRCRFVGDETEQFEYEITVTASEAGAIEASDRIAEACSNIQGHSEVESVKSTSDAPNDFRSRKTRAEQGGESE